jgi:hypothetical protein
VNNYQTVLPSEEGIWATGLLTFDCDLKGQNWTPPAVYVLNPKRTLGNFFHLCPGALVFDGVALDRLRDLIEMSGEILPLAFGKSTLYVVNVTECVNALDDEKTGWVIADETGSRIGIQSHAFHAGRLTESPLFKIPETSRAEIYTVAGRMDSDDEFKGRVEQCGLKGLIFEEVWSDE